MAGRPREGKHFSVSADEIEMVAGDTAMRRWFTLQIEFVLGWLAN